MIAGGWRLEGEVEAMSGLRLVSIHHTDGVNQLRRAAETRKRKEKNKREKKKNKRLDFRLRSTQWEQKSEYEKHFTLYISNTSFMGKEVRWSELNATDSEGSL